MALPSDLLKAVLRMVLMITCILALPIGLTICFLGLWLLTNSDRLRTSINMLDVGGLEVLERYKTDVIEVIDQYDVVSKIALSVLLLGLLVAIIAVLGIIGACTVSDIFLTVYIVLMSFIALAILGVAIFCGIFRERISASLAARMYAIQDHYFISITSLLRNKNTAKGLVTLSLNLMHISLKCCGVIQIGDARNSTSWQTSERRISELVSEGAKLSGGDGGGSFDWSSLTGGGGRGSKAKAGRRRRRRALKDFDYKLFDGSGGIGGQPDWLKYQLPPNIKIPKDFKLPKQLPKGFKVSENLLKELGAAGEKGTKLTEDVIKSTLSKELTLRTPITCCQFKNAQELLKQPLSLQALYQGMEEVGCIFQEQNYGVNTVTCYEAFWAYLDRFLVPLITLTTVLLLCMAVSIGCAVGLILLM